MVRLVWVTDVEAFADASRGVATGQGKLAHERVGQRVEQDKAYPRIVLTGWHNMARRAPSDVGFVERAPALLDGWITQPFLHFGLLELDEDPFTAHLGGGNPIGGGMRAIRIRCVYC